ncbi:MAG: oligosaccharide flippase family protein [Muribaculaceae bacterium]|nr:oligosaccharide flippase family protein [Muribaculaceae bacterium]
MSKGQGNISRMAMKAMGIFGGVQIMGILCSIIRTKLVALWIGPVGIGLFGLFNNALELISTGTNLGIRSSSVRDISQATENRNSSATARIITVVRKWSLWLGLAGALLTLVMAPLLSQVTFGDSTHIWGFVALSIAVLLQALTNGEYAVLQGTARLKRLASVTLWGTIVGLVVSIPLFYLMREQSILPSIIAYALALALFAWLFRSREYPPVQTTRRETFDMGKGFVRLGIYMTLGNFATILASYAFNAWLNVNAGTDQVGFYQAGYTLINKYTGLILTALGMEYYPRLSKVAESRLRLRAFVSQEINVAMAVMAPVVALFILLREVVVWILYTPEFNVILTFVSWGMIGTVLRTMSWCLAFTVLAKGDGKTYLWTEIASAIINLVLNIVFYRWWGLTGLGIAFFVSYLLYTLIIAAVYFKNYHLSLTRASFLNLLWTLAVAASVMVCVETGSPIAAGIITIVSIAASSRQIITLWKRR